MSGNEAKLKLIQQLLAKAESTTPEEAEALTEHAQRLMIRHGIDMALVEAMKTGAEVKPEEIIARSMTIKGQYNRQLVNLVNGISQGFNVKVVRSSPAKQQGYCTIWMYGHESDVASVEQLYTSLFVQVERAAKAWWDTRRHEWFFSPYDRLVEHRSFRQGFADRIYRRMKDIRKTTIDEVKQTTGNGAELVLVNREQAVQRFVEMNVGKLRSGRATRIRSANAYQNGKDAADRVDIGATRLANKLSLTS